MTHAQVAALVAEAAARLGVSVDAGWLASDPTLMALATRAEAVGDPQATRGRVDSAVADVRRILERLAVVAEVAAVMAGTIRDDWRAERHINA